jgi:NAD/NADP transhydrogenase beta subunit
LLTLLNLQVIASLAAGGLIGNSVASRINITDLPQMVAAYHSLVGLAAAITSIANIMLLADSGHGADGVHMVTALLGDVIGAITLTGSVRTYSVPQQSTPQTNTAPSLLSCAAMAFCAHRCLDVDVCLAISHSAPDAHVRLMLLMVMPLSPHSRLLTTTCNA